MKLLRILAVFLMALAVLCAGCSSKDPAPAANASSANAAAAAKTEKPKYLDLFVEEDGIYTDKEHVAAYIIKYKKLPQNYITKAEAQKLGWPKQGSLDKVAPGRSIGGDTYGNREGLLPKGHWKECDIGYVKGSRNSRRIVFSSSGEIYYTKDHYASFQKLN